jgi:RNA 3'-terminal phosphate cyclase (ATP)
MMVDAGQPAYPSIAAEWRRFNCRCGMRRNMLTIDGSYGEGGGQILRSALTLAAMTRRPVHITRIRGNRPRPGLAAQHLTAVRAAAAICDAHVEGDALGSQDLTFAPGTPALAGDYDFDVGAARQGGSAGAVTLVLQTVLLPLALVDGQSRLRIHGGTHMAWSPSYDYVANVWLPMLARLGARADVALLTSGWFPVGRGEVAATVHGVGLDVGRLRPLQVAARGRLRRILGRAIAANLPEHIPRRMTVRAREGLAHLNVPFDVTPVAMQAACPGAGLFLHAEYDHVVAGFDALGARGKTSEQVADEAVEAFRQYDESGAVLDRHLADQLLLPLCFATGASSVMVEAVTTHLTTNAWVVGQFGVADVNIVRRPDGTGEMNVMPTGL